MTTSHEPTENERKRPTRGLRGLRAAHLLGSNGEPLPADATRPQTIAHKIGRNYFERGLAMQEQLDQQADAKFMETVEKAQGFNKDILLILQEAAHIPTEHSSTPLVGHGWKEGGVRSVRRVRDFGKGKHALPLIDGLPEITVDDVAWSTAAPFKIDVETFSVTSSAVEDETGNVSSVSTTLHFNDLPYDPDTLPLEHSPRLQQSMRLVIGPSGEITEVGLRRANVSGFTKEDPARMQIDLAGFLAGAKDSVEQTVKAHQDIKSF